MTPEQESVRGRDAQTLLDSTLFREARAFIEENMRTLRRHVPIQDQDMHTRLILMEQLWGNLIGWFEQTALTGKFAELEIEKKTRLQRLQELGVSLFSKTGRGSL